MCSPADFTVFWVSNSVPDLVHEVDPLGLSLFSALAMAQAGYCGSSNTLSMIGAATLSSSRTAMASITLSILVSLG